MVIHPPKSLFIPKGSINQIITYLDSLNINPIDSYILRFIGHPQTGYIHIGEESLTRLDFLYYITIAKAKSIDITLIPGETNYFFMKSIATKLNLNFEKLSKEYNDYAPFKDGVILPETYKIPISMNEREVIRYLIDNSLTIHKKIAMKLLGRFNLDEWFKYITIASVIQKEAGSIKEMPIVSAVIYNRIKKKMKLQMDGTLNYGKYSHTKITADRIKTDESPYNTYKISALPPSPISSTSFEAIYSSLNPANVDYLYFVKGKDGEHKFSKTYKSHIQNINYSNR